MGSFCGSLSISVYYACSCLFLSVAVCFLHFLFVFHLLRIEYIISIISFLFIIWIMINTSSTYNISFMYSLHSLDNNTRVTCSSALSGRPSSSYVKSSCCYSLVHILSTAFPDKGAQLRKQRLSSGDHGRPLYPRKTHSFAPESVFSHEFTRSRSPTLPNYLQVLWLTWWCGSHDDVVTWWCDSWLWQSFVIRKFPN